MKFAVNEAHTSGTVQNILLHLFSENLTYRHSGGFNKISIRAVRSEYSGLYMTFGALLAAVMAGLLMRAFVPESLYLSLNSNIFTAVRKIFMNGLKVCAVPIVFCSIAVCIADAGSLSGLRKIGAHLMKCVLAVLVGSAGASTGAVLITKFLNEINGMFMRITRYFMHFVPLGLLLAILAGLAVMNVIVCLAVKFVAGLKPSVLYKKSLPVIITAFTTCSSSAALPGAGLVSKLENELDVEVYSQP